MTRERAAATAAVALAICQVVDAAANAVVSPAYLARHFDHLRVPATVRRLLQPIKIASSVALLATYRMPRMRAATAGALVSYYSAAASYHVLAGNRWVVAVPAGALGGVAAAIVAAVSSAATALPAANANARLRGCAVPTQSAARRQRLCLRSRPSGPRR